MPPGYNEAQVRIGEWIRSVQITVNYNGYRIELRSIAPVLTEKIYMFSFKVKYEAEKDFFLAVTKKSWVIPGFADTMVSLAKMIPNLKQEEKDRIDLIRKEFTFPAVRTGSLEVDNKFDAKGNNVYMAQEIFADWRVREALADPHTPFRSLQLRGTGFDPDYENSLVLAGGVDPTKTAWLKRGFEVVQAELDVLRRLSLIKKAPGA